MSTSRSCPTACWTSSAVVAAGSPLRLALVSTTGPGKRRNVSRMLAWAGRRSPTVPAGQTRWRTGSGKRPAKPLSTPPAMIKVSGPITAAPNTLIPSTENAITSANYRQRMRSGKRRQSRAFLIDHDGRLTAFHDRDDRVGRAEVDSNNFVRHL